MDFRQTLSAELPPSRDGEPPSLRDDIVDELADHLACAYKRELLRGTPANVAHTRVLEQFGNPAAVARRLWFDAMKGKIMTQRILIGACALLLIVFCGVALLLMRQQSVLAEREVAEANFRLAQALAQTQATNEEMLKQMRTMAAAFQPGQTPDWIPVSFKLTQEALDGPPVVGCDVSLGRGTGGAPMAGGAAGGMGKWASADAIHRVSDENGLVDFGVVQPGDWQFNLIRRWKGQNGWHAHGSLNVLPGIKIVKSIICPKAPPEAEDVTFRIAWPADLASRQYLVQASFQHAGVTYQAPVHWILGPHFALGGEVRETLIGTRQDGIKQTDLRMDGSLYFWRFADPNEGGAGPNEGGTEGAEIQQRNPTGVFADLRTEYAPLDTRPRKLDVGKYNVIRLVLLRSYPSQNRKIPRERFEVLAYTSANSMWPSFLGINVVARPPDEIEHPYPQQVEMGQGGGMAQSRSQLAARTKFVAVSDSYWQSADAHFEAQPGAPCAWTIHLPDELIKRLRDEIKSKQPAKANAE
jgi:hypothetical protein